MSLLIPPIANKKVVWDMPSWGSAYDDEWEGGACMDILAHGQVKLDGINTSGKVYVKPVRRNCGRFECPVCYETWVARSAKRIEHRFNEYFKMRAKQWEGFSPYVHHTTVSLPQNIEQGELQDNMGKYRSKVYALLKRVGIHGGALIYHPYRWKCLNCGANRKMGKKTCSVCGGDLFMRYFSPHFHIIGLGFIRGYEVKRVYEETGYVIKDINSGPRNTFRTAQYQLSHCARRRGGRAFSWFGTLSYLKFKSGKYQCEGEPCPICGKIMVPVEYLGGGDEPFVELPEYKKGYLDDSSNWDRVDPDAWKTNTRYRGEVVYSG